MRFDSNRYSVPPERVMSTLTPEAVSRRARILGRGEVVAEHRSCPDKHQMVENHDHISALKRYMVVFVQLDVDSRAK